MTKSNTRKINLVSVFVEIPNKWNILSSIITQNKQLTPFLAMCKKIRLAVKISNKRKIALWKALLKKCKNLRIVKNNYLNF
ncbi:hypothetical protein BpHYR1_013900 [Brachionus plicatilis]|uniref:Uncharacterized protein n=1 Tax=Brachionus plicatilis TaxID=10195 RepID=A0A3M7RJG8_BRAPC|nr:hypothetical protein BpHYR1_013900 [Brachionus plicatilis]